MKTKRYAFVRCTKDHWAGEFPVVKGTTLLLPFEESEKLDPDEWEEICAYTGTDSVSFTPYSKPQEPGGVK